MFHELQPEPILADIRIDWASWRAVLEAASAAAEDDAARGQRGTENATPEDRTQNDGSMWIPPPTARTLPLRNVPPIVFHRRATPTVIHSLFIDGVRHTPLAAAPLALRRTGPWLCQTTCNMESAVIAHVDSRAAQRFCTRYNS